MSTITVIGTGMAGVDMKQNALFLPEDRLSEATNTIFDEGVIRSRYGFRYTSLGAKGQFQGATIYSPSRGLSHQPFSDPFTAVVVACCGGLSYNLSIEEGFSSSIPIKGPEVYLQGDINLYQAENYLIVQSHNGSTLWWEGYGNYLVSPGLQATEEKARELIPQMEVNSETLTGANIDCCFQKIDICGPTPDKIEEASFGSHDTFIFENHTQFLSSESGLGIYVHGRVHQETSIGILVGDIIHKRGNLSTDDILLMEEQEAGSFGDPLSAPSRIGQLRAMEVLPRMRTANGEGDLIAYYDTGVVAFNTFLFPRETITDPVSGETVQKGWSSQRQTEHLLNNVSAVGRYAVGVLPRDHMFRSRYGIHLLSLSLGEGSFNDETTNTLSQDVQPILDSDDKADLAGVTAGQWNEGSRLMCSVGMISDDLYTSSSMGRGFVVWNRATTYTDDRTPRPIWEGLWSPDNSIAGVHRLIDATSVGGINKFGFVGSMRSGAELVFAEIDKDLCHDIGPDGESIPIEWCVTSRMVFGGFNTLNHLRDGRLELETSGEKSQVRVLVRTDRSPEWQEWHGETIGDTCSALHSINLGQPPKECREASWFQMRVEGYGYGALRSLEARIEESVKKLDKPVSTSDLTKSAINYHRFNSQPSTKRWTLAQE